MSELVIGVSNIISSLCSSVIRVEPYTDCCFRCVYCYARWYRYGASVIRDRVEAIKAFATLARRVKRLGLAPYPARVSTLADPLQPHEELFRATLKVLRIALDYEYPIILNTKGVLLAKDPWRKVLAKLGELGLLAVQVSISTLDPRISRALEPIAPPPMDRLAAASELCSSCGAIVRISPFIPRISTYPSPRELSDTLKSLGVSMVIVEGLRVERDRASAITKLLGVSISWEPYSLREVEGLKPVVRVSLRERAAEYSSLARELSRAGIEFSTCKEGLYWLHTAGNCCGMHMLRDSSWRPTLWEIYRVLQSFGPLGIEEALDRARKEFSDRLWSDRLAQYPRMISKMLKYHEKKMLKILGKPEVLEHICPSIRVENGKLVAVANPMQSSAS